MRTAIYCRVSSEDQAREDKTSLDTQLQACSKYCEARDYIITHQFRETYSGLTIDRPELDRLRQLVHNQLIECVVIYSLDRLTRDPNHGVILRQEREQYGVELEAVTETVDSSKLGQLIEYIYGYAANLEAERLRDRTQRGIRARVFDKKKPVTYTRGPFGYDWDKDNNCLVPNSDHDVVKMIFTWAIAGKTYDWIISELKRCGILSPYGLPDWNKHTIATILHNPVYTGRYYAFKSQAVEPKKKLENEIKRSKRLKSSVKRLPQTEWHLIPEVKVIKPPVCLTDFMMLQDDLIRRQKLSSRNAKRTYLLRGFIECSEHTGKGGRARIFCGQPHHNIWRYTCPVGGCHKQYLDGPRVENIIKNYISTRLFINDELFNSMAQQISKKSQKKTLKTELSRLRSRLTANEGMEVKLEERVLKGITREEIAARIKDNIHAERVYLKREEHKVLDQLAHIVETEDIIKRLAEIRIEFAKRMFNNQLSIGDWRGFICIWCLPYFILYQTIDRGYLWQGTHNIRSYSLFLRQYAGG